MAVCDFQMQVEALYENEFRALLNRAKSQLGDSGQAEDSVQEAFVALIARGDLKGVRNPAALLTTILDRRITDELRRRYSAKASSFEPEPDKILGPAEVYEAAERRELIREAIDELHGPTRQIVKLFSLGYKVREISEFEEANGRSSSPRVVTVRLHRAKERLRENLKRKGMGLTVVPFSWLRRVSLRLRILGDRFWQLTPFVETSQVFETALVFVLSSGLLLPGAGIKGLSSGVRASNTTSVAFMLLNPATPSVDAEANRVGQGVRRQGDFLQANSGQSDASVRSPLRLEENEHRPAVARTVPVETPDKEASDSPSVPKEIIIHTPTGGTLDAREYRPDQDGKPAPPLPNQARDLVEDPSQISLPRCGGIAICDDLPNTIGDLAKP